MQELLLFIHHHLLLNSALLGVLFVLILLEFIKQKNSASRLTPAQVTQLMNHDNALIIDLRPANAFLDGHIIGATSMPQTDLAEKMKKFDKFKVQPIILVCAAGLDAVRAAATLRQQGFNASLLAGGMRAWREAEMPIVKG